MALPATYRKMAEPLNIVGAIELEASPWVEDNLWVLEQMQTDTLYVGATRAAILGTQVTASDYQGSFMVTVTYQ